MQRIIKILSLFFCLVVYSNTQAQCTVTVDVANLQHINCPNGGAVGGASIIQASYINYSWQNITNGQLYNGGGGYGGTIRTDLDAGLYVITASTPYSSSCPSMIYSDTFEILEATPQFQFNPTQACPDTCNVEVTIDMQIAITGVNYLSSFDSYPVSEHHALIFPKRHVKDYFEFFKKMMGYGIKLQVHYIPVHLQPFYQHSGFSRGDFPVSESFYSRAISLPLFPGLAEEDQDHVIKSLSKAVTR